MPSIVFRDLVTALFGDDPQVKRRARHRLIQSQVRRALDAWDMAQRGTVEDSWGRTIDEEASGFDVATRAIGVGTVAQAERGERIGREYRARERYQKRRAQFLDRAARAYSIGDGDEVQRIRAEAQQAGITITFDQVRRKVAEEAEGDLRNRVGRTPRDLRRELFTEEELREARRRRRPVPSR